MAVEAEKEEGELDLDDLSDELGDMGEDRVRSQAATATATAATATDAGADAADAVQSSSKPSSSVSSVSSPASKARASDADMDASSKASEQKEPPTASFSGFGTSDEGSFIDSLFDGGGTADQHEADADAEGADVMEDGAKEGSEAQHAESKLTRAQKRALRKIELDKRAKLAAQQQKEREREREEKQKEKRVCQFYRSPSVCLLLRCWLHDDSLLFIFFYAF